MKYEIKRKSLHIFAAIVPVMLIYFPWQVMITPLAVFTVSGVLIDLFRTKSKILGKIYGIFFGDILRDHETEGKFTGATCYFLSLTFSYFVFHFLLGMDIVYIAVIYSGFMIGDAAAALVGKRIGKIKLFNSKTLEGSLAFFISCALSTFWIIPSMIPFVLLISLMLTAIELLLIKLDDNLFVPLIATIIVFFFV